MIHVSGLFLRKPGIVHSNSFSSPRVLQWNGHLDAGCSLQPTHQKIMSAVFVKSAQWDRCSTERTRGCSDCFTDITNNLTDICSGESFYRALSHIGSETCWPCASPSWSHFRSSRLVLSASWTSQCTMPAVPISRGGR